jgi:hypothetical protein
MGVTYVQHLLSVVKVGCGATAHSVTGRLVGGWHAAACNTANGLHGLLLI